MNAASSEDEVQRKRGSGSFKHTLPGELGLRGHACGNASFLGPMYSFFDDETKARRPFMSICLPTRFGGLMGV
jgi:hypothetical protein